jgi:glutamine synthetase
MEGIEKVKAIVSENEIKYIDLRFTSISGVLHSMNFTVDFAMEELEKGLFFDGSSIKGFKSIDKSDMIMKPDFDSCFIDPYAARPTLAIICDIKDPFDNNEYSKDPRTIARKAEDYLKSTKIANQAFFGPEPEFFIFDDVKYSNDKFGCFYSLDSIEFPNNSSKSYPHGNSGYRSQSGGGYLSPKQKDVFRDLRAEIMENLSIAGVNVNLEHHEVAPSQSEIGIKYSTCVGAADNVQKLKHIVHMAASSYGKSATFMPKPIYKENGSGMHVHQSLWLDNHNLFANTEDYSISDIGLYYIGGILKHARALAAFTNPSTNSYKRLVPGYEAPVYLAYSMCNRSASIRIPFSNSHNSRRIEARFPDPSANPYLCFAAMLMAGIDGIENKILPGEAADENLYNSHRNNLDILPRSLNEALLCLEMDYEFLMKDNVFSKDFLQTYVNMKMSEVTQVEMSPHPMEFELYY